jgi:hypothetical protein
MDNLVESNTNGAAAPLKIEAVAYPDENSKK